MITKQHLKQIEPHLWEIEPSFRSDMRVPARVYVNDMMLDELLAERSLEQLVNVSTLPGAERHVLAMPDIHQGYGFPIGGIAALRAEDGVISPGGVGYDINCGVRLLASRTPASEIEDRLEAFANQIQRDVPSGVGRSGPVALKHKEIDAVLNDGARWTLRQGFADESDLEMTEEQGCYAYADARDVPERAKHRGADQLGTLGSGNHFLEVQQVTEIFDRKAADGFGLFEGQLAVLIHTGSRGLGHETCTEYVRVMNGVMGRYRINLPDRELACAPFRCEEGQRYFRAMAASANFAWANRQLITFAVRGAWRRVFNEEPRLRVLYDVAHNIAKLEQYDGVDVVVHRKGATRAFAAGSRDIPDRYRSVGQPVLIPGSMGTASYVAVGGPGAMEMSFGSCCHGAGRCLSRTAAKKKLDYNKLRAELSEYGVLVRAASAKGLLEEAPQAYKSVDDVVRVVHESGIARTVARLRPIAVIKG